MLPRKELKEKDKSKNNYNEMENEWSKMKREWSKMEITDAKMRRFDANMDEGGYEKRPFLLCIAPENAFVYAGMGIDDVAGVRG